MTNLLEAPLSQDSTEAITHVVEARITSVLQLPSETDHKHHDDVYDPEQIKVHVRREQIRNHSVENILPRRRRFALHQARIATAMTIAQNRIFRGQTDQEV